MEFTKEEIEYLVAACKQMADKSYDIAGSAIGMPTVMRGFEESARKYINLQKKLEKYEKDKKAI